MVWREWLKCSDKKAKKQNRRENVEKRMYKRAVGRAKRKFEESRRNELENMKRKFQEMVEKGEVAGYDGW